MSKPRIYIAIATFHPLVGGAELQALAQGRVLRERGYEATIITFRHKTVWPRREVMDGVPVIRVAGTILRNREKLPKPLKQAFYMLALIVMGWTLWLHRRQYDILHVYQLSLLAIPTALACRLSSRPMIISVRSAGSGKAMQNRKPGLAAGPLDPATPWLSVEGQNWVDGDLEGLVRMGPRVLNFTRSLLLKIQAQVIVISSRMKDYLSEYDFLLPGVMLIPNGVDINRFRPAQQGSTEETKALTVVCVSKLRYEKGIDVLLQAWHLVHQQLPQARLVLIGSGPLQTQLSAMAEALHITESVEFAGLQSDVPAQLRKGQIAVLPSRWEGMPNAVLEAMACGLPCVATRVSGSEDIIQNGLNGLLVESEDYEGMAEALLQLLRNPERVQAYKQQARLTIEQHYAMEHITDIYVELYQRLVVGRGAITQDISPTEPYPLSS